MLFTEIVASALIISLDATPSSSTKCSTTDFGQITVIPIVDCGAQPCPSHIAQGPPGRGADGQDARLGEAHQQEAAQEEPHRGAGQALRQVSIFSANISS